MAQEAGATPTITPIIKALRVMSPDEREQWAALAKTRVNYLYHLGGGQRRPGVRLAVRIEDASREMHRQNPKLPIVTVREMAETRTPTASEG